MNKDIIIVGCGPSGITASIYAKRAGFNPIIIEKYMPGGKLPLAHKIDNYPGFTSIGGSDLATSFVNAISENNITMVFDEIIEITKEDNVFTIKGRYKTYTSNAVIIASGTSDKKMGIPGEKEFAGKGVSTCAVCDGQFFKGKPMAVVGGNSKALEEALYLSSLTDTVYVINKLSFLEGDEILINNVLSDPHIKVLNGTLPLKINGDKLVSSLEIENIDTHEQSVLSLNAIFVYVGSSSNASFASFKDIFDDKGYIITNEKMETRIDGLFASGDCRSKYLRQIVTATSDGAIAAMSAINYLKKLVE